MPIATRRADALVHLVTTERAATGSGSVRRPQANVHLTMDLPTALGLADHPSELAGYGPIDAATARALAADGKWRRLICEPLTGALLDLGHTTYQPSAALARYIQLRDVRCQFPSCNQPARRCHLDHTRRYEPDDPAGGKTDRNNLGALCEHHHRLKHRVGWTLSRNPDTEEATWTSPTGHRYPIDHEDHRTWDHRLGGQPDDAFEGDACWNDLEAPEEDPVPAAPIPAMKGAVAAA